MSQLIVRFLNFESSSYYHELNWFQIKLEDAMEDEELKFGPNGGLIFCMEYLMENMEWLQRQLSGAVGEEGEVT